MVFYRMRWVKIKKHPQCYERNTYHYHLCLYITLFIFIKFGFLKSAENPVSRKIQTKDCFYKLFTNSAIRWVFLCCKIISSIDKSYIILTHPLNGNIIHKCIVSYLFRSCICKEIEEREIWLKREGQKWMRENKNFLGF